MEEKSKTSPAEIEQQLTELIPLNIIRTETVISRLPIHNLAKRGNINISITKKNAKGEVVLHWEVSPNPRYGAPLQLAYKLDTIVINRRIDEFGKPLPKIIRLGSLRDIAKSLDLKIGGDSSKRIRSALFQNAFVAINAKLTYIGNDGTERALEAGFTRYGVVFTGQKLPDGTKADAVYLTLNDPYREVLNNAPVRPLDYDYLRKLPPAPQRFYEIVSRRMFAALKYQRAEAKLSYSDYCTYSAQQRYFDYDHFKKQMYKVHRPHLLSGYLKATRYEQTRDADEKTDWIMYYAPGPKAKAEYHTFTRSGRVLETSAETVGEEVKLSEKPPAAPRRTGPRQKRLNLQEPVDNPTLGEMIRRGISRARAQAILAAAPQPELVMDQLEWGDAQISRSRPGEIRNPAGFYIHLVKENILPPPGFETTRRAKLREEAYRAEQEENYQRLLQEEAYQRYRGETIESFIREQRLEGECQRLAEKATGEIRAQWRRNAPADVVTELADRKARQIIAERIPALLTLEAFIQQNKQAIPAP